MKLIARKACSFGGKKFYIDDEIPAELVLDPRTQEKRDVLTIVHDDAGTAPDAKPEEVRIETYVRGSSIDGIAKNNKKVNRALIGAAYSIGANIEIIDIPGYAPLVNDKNMVELAKDAAAIAMPDRPFTVYHNMIASSTDMGDLSTFLPVVHPYCPGAQGKGHGNDFEIHDPYLACVQNAKWQVTMLTLLLGNGAERAKKVISEFVPYFKSKE